MSDLIDRQNVLDTLEVADTFLDEERTVEMYKALLTECIKVLPSVENRGEWIEDEDIDVNDDGKFAVKCSKCGEYNGYRKTNFCPNCGAMMKGCE